MTNSLAIQIGIVVTCALVIDAILFGGQGFLFLALKFTELLRWLAFWR